MGRATGETGTAKALVVIRMERVRVMLAEGFSAAVLRWLAACSRGLRFSSQHNELLTRVLAKLRAVGTLPATPSYDGQ